MRENSACDVGEGLDADLFLEGSALAVGPLKISLDI